MEIIVLENFSDLVSKLMEIKKSCLNQRVQIVPSSHPEMRLKGFDILASDDVEPICLRFKIADLARDPVLSFFLGGNQASFISARFLNSLLNSELTSSCPMCQESEARGRYILSCGMCGLERPPL
jgi:hypothetical protein